MTAAKDTQEGQDNEARLAEFETLAREAIDSVARSMGAESGAPPGIEAPGEHSYTPFWWLTVPRTGAPVRIAFARGHGREANTYALFRVTEWDKSAIVGPDKSFTVPTLLTTMHPLPVAYDLADLTKLVDDAAHNRPMPVQLGVNRGVAWLNEFISAVNELLSPICKSLFVTCDLEQSTAPDEYVIISGHMYRWLIHLGIRPKGTTNVEFNVGFVILDDNSIKAAMSDKLSPNSNAKSGDSIAHMGPIDRVQIAKMLELFWRPLQEKLRHMLPATN